MSRPPESSSGPSPAASDAPGAAGLRLGTYRDLWADYVSERNPSLEFLSPEPDR